MLNLTKDSKIDFEKYFEDLSYLGYIYINPKKVRDAYNELYYIVLSRGYLCSEIIRTKSGGVLPQMDRKTIFKFLTEFENCPESFFYNKKTEGFSLDAKKVLGALYDRGYAQEFISSYIEYNSLKAQAALLKGLLDKSIPSDEKNYLGQDLVKIRFDLNEADNMRVYYRNHSIGSIPKDYIDCIEAPSDYFFVSGDFEQSDLRIAYSMMLRNEDNVDLINNISDMYEVFARIYLGKDFDLEHFRENRKKLYKANTLAPIYGGTKGNTPFEQKFVNAANSYLQTCPRYKTFKDRLQKKIDLNVPIIVDSYFGNQQTIDKFKGFKKLTNNELLDKALNAPIQQGTSEIVIATERYIMSEFEKLGFTSDNGKIYAYINRHDELIFMVHKELMPYVKIFQKAQTIKVDDWAPLKISFSYSRVYNKEDKVMQQMAESYYDKDLNDNFKVVYNPNEYFIPTSDVLDITVGINEDIDAYYISMYADDYKKCEMFSMPKVDSDTLLKEIYRKIAVSSENLISNNCNFVNLNLPIPIVNESVNLGVYTHLTNQYSPELSLKANVLAMAAKVLDLRDKGVEVDTPDLIEKNKDFVNAILRNGSWVQR